MLVMHLPVNYEAFDLVNAGYLRSNPSSPPTHPLAHNPYPYVCTHLYSAARHPLFLFLVPQAIYYSLPHRSYLEETQIHGNLLTYT